MRALLFILLCCAAAAAQSLSGVNASASRTVTLAPDEASIRVAASTGLEGGEPQVKQILQDAGLPNPTVVALSLTSGVSLPQMNAPQVYYQAAVTIPASSAKDVAKSLEALRAKPVAPLTSFQYAMSFHASQAGIDAARQAVLPQLMAEAQKKAEALAMAAGVKLGTLRWIADSAGGGAPYAGNASPVYILYGAIASFLPTSPGPGLELTFSVNVIFNTAQ